jgi:hypothetical protein
MEQSSQDYFMTPFHTENLTGSQRLNAPAPVASSLLEVKKLAALLPPAMVRYTATATRSDSTCGGHYFTVVPNSTPCFDI